MDTPEGSGVTSSSNHRRKPMTQAQRAVLGAIDHLTRESMPSTTVDIARFLGLHRRAVSKSIGVLLVLRLVQCDPDLGWRRAVGGER